MHEIILSTDKRLGGCFHTLDAAGRSLDFGLTYGPSRSQIFLLATAATDQRNLVDIRLPLADVRALRDFLNGLDLTDPAPLKEMKRMRAMASSMREAVRYAIFPAKKKAAKKRPRKVSA